MHRQLYLLRCRVIAFDEQLFQDSYSRILLRLDIQPKHFFFFTPTHSQYPVRWCCFDRFRPVEIVFIFYTCLFLAGYHFRLKCALFKEKGSDLCPCFRILCDQFCDDVPCSGQGFFGVVNTFFFINIFCSFRFRIDAVLLEKQVGQWLQTFFACCRCSCFAFGAVG